MRGKGGVVGRGGRVACGFVLGLVISAWFLVHLLYSRPEIFLAKTLKEVEEFRIQAANDVTELEERLNAAKTDIQALKAAKDALHKEVLHVRDTNRQLAERVDSMEKSSSSSCSEVGGMQVVGADPKGGGGILVVEKRSSSSKGKKKSLMRPAPLLDTSPRMSAVYLSYLGGPEEDQILAACAGTPSGIWVAGSSESPRTAKGGTGRGVDAMIAKLKNDGTSELVVGLGGSGEDVATGIALAPAGGVWVVGYTNSPDLVVTANAPQPKLGGRYDAFIALVSEGGKVKFLTYLGGRDVDKATSIVAVDNRLWLAGETQSSNMPTTADADRVKRGAGGSDGFMCRIGSDGRLQYMSYVSGEAGSDGVADLAKSSDGGVWASGYMTPRRQRHPNAMLERVSPTGALMMEIQLGGEGSDRARAVVGQAGGESFFVVGDTTSKDVRLTRTVPPAEGDAANVTAPPGILAHSDVFVSRLRADGSMEGFGRLRGIGKDTCDAAAISAGGLLLWIGGTTTSPDFPVTEGALRRDFAGKSEAFVAKINTNKWLQGGAVTPLSLSYFGGSGEERINVLLAAKDGSMWAAGWTSSKDLKVSDDALQKKFGGGAGDGFVARLS